MFLFVILNCCLFLLFYHFAEEQLFYFPLEEVYYNEYWGFKCVITLISIIFVYIVIKNLFMISDFETILLDWERKELEIDVPNILKNNDKEDQNKTQKVKI